MPGIHLLWWQNNHPDLSGTDLLPKFKHSTMCRISIFMAFLILRDQQRYGWDYKGFALIVTWVICLLMVFSLDA